MIWKAIKDWEGVYEVSDAGLVRSLDREITALNPKGVLAPRKYKGRVLRLNAASNGYLMVSFTGPNRKRRGFTVHKLVTEAFLGPRPALLEVCHRDGDRANNRIENLRYDTRTNNYLDNVRLGRDNKAVGEAAGSAKLTEDNVRFIRANADKLGQREMGRMFDVSHNAIKWVITRKSWGHVE